MTFETAAVRVKFPALNRPVIYLDNPGGTQIAQGSIDRLNRYLVDSNANFHGVFTTSRLSDAVIAQARQAAADFLNAESPREIIFGSNMTTLTFRLSRSIARTWNPGDKIMVTRLEHDANITPWVLAAEERGCQILIADFDPESGTLNIEDMEKIIQEEKPVLVAIGYASNAIGTINPLKMITDTAKKVGALVYVDAVQYAPHAPIDVLELGCDFLVFSAYKVFGPHIGVLYGRLQLLESLPAQKVRPASNEPPEKFETGTKNHEGIAGLLGTFEYLEWLGECYGNEFIDQFQTRFQDRKMRLKCAMAAIQNYERNISHALTEMLLEMPGVTLYGPGRSGGSNQRVPTFGFRVKGHDSRSIAKKLDQHNIYVWSGNFYALAVTERLGVEDKGGMVRVGAVHYNTLDEIEEFGEALSNIIVS